MTKLKNLIVNNTKVILFIYIILLITAFFTMQEVEINQDNASYLPKDKNSYQAVEKLSEEFDINGSADLLLKDVTIEETKSILADIEKLSGVKRVIWIEEQHYINNNALLGIYFVSGNDDEETWLTLDEIKKIVGDRGDLAGSAALSKSTSDRIAEEIPIYSIVAGILVIIILLLATTSYLEPLIFLITIGAAILINMGSNIFQGEISWVTYSAAALLQLAVSMDYSIFLLHRFHEEREKGNDPKTAMINSMKLSFKSIFASGITTVAGFLALVFMDYGIGNDMGFVLAKGVLLSLISVMTLLPVLVIIFDKWIEKTSHKELKYRIKVAAKAAIKYRYIAIIVTIILAGVFYNAQSNVDYYYSNKNILPENDIAFKTNLEIEKIYGYKNESTIIVPKGDKMNELNCVKAIKEIENVTEVSNIYTIFGENTPEEYIPKEYLDMYQSDEYSLINLNLRCGKEDYESFNTAEKIRDTVEKFYNEYYIAGELFTYYDLNDITITDAKRTTILSILFIFVILLITFKSISIPLITVFIIETGIWVNMGISYFLDTPTSFLTFIIIGAIQLGSTIDYAILFINRYRDNLLLIKPIKAAMKTIQDTYKSILTSGGILVAATFSVYFIATVRTSSEMCLMIGRGAIISMFAVLFLLPGFLITLEPIIKRTTLDWPTKKGKKNE